MAVIAVVLTAMAGCTSIFDNFATKPRPNTFKSVHTEKYLELLTQAKLSLESGNESEIKTHLKALDNYTAHKKPDKKILEQQVAVFEYSLQGGNEKRYLIAPLETKNQFSSLQALMKKLIRMPHTLHNINLYNVSFSIPSATKFNSSDLSDAREKIYSQENEIISTAQEIPSLEMAKMQLALTKLFIQARIRDAAYISMENTKESLAKIAEKHPGAEISRLSKEADEMEVILHKELPYKF